VFAGIIAALTATQIGIIASQTAPAPTFSEGGIVGPNGRIPFSNDAVMAQVHVGETIRNPRQEAALQSNQNVNVMVGFTGDIGDWKYVINKPEFRNELTKAISSAVKAGKS
jgi:hypothetical protein